MPPLVLQLWLRLTIKGRITPRDCGWRKLRVTHSCRYCRFLWGQSVVWDWVSAERKSWNGSLFRSLTLLKFLFSRESSEAGQRRARKEGNEYKMMPNRRNMYTVQNNTGIQYISTYLGYCCKWSPLFLLLLMVIDSPENWGKLLCLNWSSGFSSWCLFQISIIYLFSI